eukprot:10321497-Ditylum_brightwellii.AAC.1
MPTWLQQHVCHGAQWGSMTTVFVALQGKLTMSSTKLVTDTTSVRRDGSVVAEMETDVTVTGMTGVAHIPHLIL